MADKIKILIVDDRPENLVALEHLLDEPDWQTIRATSGNEALKLVLAHDFALILLDVQMPDMNGFETAELMRANPKTRRIPIIFVTAISREQKYVFKGYESGAVDYISKPVEPQIVRSKVKVFAQLYQQRREIQDQQFALARANKELSDRNKQLQDELDLARAVQLGLLPTTFPHKDRVIFGQYYCICTTLGGDIFDAFSLGQDHVGFYMADVAGHGVSAALISGLLKMSFEGLKSRAAADGGKPEDELMCPDRVLTRINDLLYEKLPRDTFITLVYAVLDLASFRMKLANAGHPPPLLHQSATHEARFCAFEHGPAIGLNEEAAYPLAEADLASGDKFVLYTDGITEAMHEGQEFGEDRLFNVVRQHGHQHAGELVDAILHSVEVHRGGSPVSDDCSLLVVQMR